MSQDNMPELTIQYILKALEGIAQDNAYLLVAMDALREITQDHAGDVAGQGKAQAIGEVVKQREQTHQQMIALYTQMYNDLAKQTN